MRHSRSRQQLRISALAGTESALHVFLYALLMLPIKAAIDLTFEEKVGDWILALKVGAALAAIWCCVTFFSTFFDLRRQIQIEESANPRFPATTFIAGLYGLTTVGSIGLIIGLRREGDPVWIQILMLVFPCIAMYAWPRTIHCDERSVWQRNLWGRKKSIPYDEIQSISSGHGDAATTVVGLHAVIEHTSEHSDPAAFMHLVSKRSGKRVYY